MTKVKLISCLSMLALSLSMLVMGVLALATQTITLTGEVGFNVSDKSVYVKDARISDETITGFMPGYINEGLILSDATISGSSFEISLDVINTTTNNFDIVIETSQSGVSVTTEAYIPANSTALTEITSSTPITDTIVLTVTNSTSSPVDLTNILIKIEERTFAVLDGFVFRSNGTGTGELVSYSGSASNVDIPDTYSTMEENGETIFIEGDTYTVTAIADGSQSSYAFQNATNMTSVDIPNTVTSIGAYAFYNCTSLTTANVPTSLISIGTYAFYRCSNLSSGLSIPATLRTIDTLAFFECSSLTTPNGLDLSGITSLGRQVFRGCTTISGPVILPSISTIPEQTFYDCSGLTGGITIQPGTVEIGELAFIRCSNLDGMLSLPTSLRIIGDSAFSECSKLQSTGLDLSRITSLGDSAFFGCSSLTGALTLPSITSIPTSAFYNCRGLTGGLTINSGTTTISKNAFYGCSGLNGTLTLPSTLRTIGDSAFMSCSNLSRNGLNLSNITSLGDRAFSSCSNFTGTLTLPNLSTIPEYAFNYCSFTGTLSIPSSVTTIGDSAFDSNDFSGALSIPSNVRTIGGSAFAGLSNITRLILSSGITSIGDMAFGYMSNLTSIEYNIPSLADYSSHPSLFVYSGNASKDIEVTFGSNVTRIPAYLFSNSTSFSSTMSRPRITTVNIPSSVTYIGRHAFRNCSDLTKANFDVTSGWYYTSLSSATTGETILGLSDPATAAKYLRSDYVNYYWKCNPSKAISVYSNNTNLGTVIGSGTYNIGDRVTLTATPTNIGRFVEWRSGSTTGTRVSTSATHSFTLSSSSPTSYYAIFEENYTILEGFTFNNLPPNTGELVSYTGSDAEVEIPSSYSTAVIDGKTVFIEGDDYTVTAIADGTFTASDSGAFYSARDTLRSVSIPNTVTKIGARAFNYCTSLAEITIPNSVTSIGHNAFYSCTSLAEITVPTSVTSIGHTAFYSCTSLNSVTFEGNSQLTVINANAFGGCSSLTSITIPEGVTSIGLGAFAFCERLTTITIPSRVTAIERGAFSDCYSLNSITIPEGVTSISLEAFDNCTSLTSVTFENRYGWSAGTTSISASSLSNKSTAATYLTTTYVSRNWTWTPQVLTGFEFEGNTLITYTGSDAGVKIPDTYSTAIINGETVFIEGDDYTVTAIADASSNTSGAFYSARTTLRNVSIPDTVTKIGARAFNYCTSLAEITVPTSVTSIGEAAFFKCTSLNSVTFAGNSQLKVINQHAFSECSSLTSITIPGSVTSIGNSAFSWCSSLTSITIPSSVKSIGDSAFYECSSLTSINISEGVTSIGPWAFAYCGFTSITIPSSVTSIGNSAFNSCDSLTSVTFKETEGWRAGTTPISASDLENTSTAATYLKSTSYPYAQPWTRS